MRWERQIAWNRDGMWDVCYLPPHSSDYLGVTSLLLIVRAHFSDAARAVLVWSIVPHLTLRSTTCTSQNDGETSPSRLQ
jgi:hypothetical protein